MKKTLLSFAILLLIGAGCTNKTEPVQEQIQLSLERTTQENIFDTYNGAWFEISYPSGFEIFEREKSETSDAGYDGVSFISPDDLAEFYIYSPQWSGNSIWENIQDDEKIIDTSTEQREDGTKITKTTIQHNTEKFFRILEVVEVFDVRYVFGFRYQDDQVYNLYRDKYEEFKGSLVQFAD